MNETMSPGSQGVGEEVVGGAGVGGEEIGGGDGFGVVGEQRMKARLGKEGATSGDGKLGLDRGEGEAMAMARRA